MKRWRLLALLLALVLMLSACTPVVQESATTTTPPATATPTESTSEELLDPDGTYDTKDEVALYLFLYGKLPSNYVTKSQAKKLYGWEGGALSKIAPGKCIGGDRFSNYQGVLPKKAGRQYYECDIGTLGNSARGAKRIVYSNDGLIYYTDDHYETFELLYGVN